MVLRLQGHEAACHNLGIDTIRCRANRNSDQGIKSHILIRFLADVRGRTLQKGQSWASLGDSPRTILNEFFHNTDRRTVKVS
jgi:hypothetical protein